jgi:hypothetical protein
VRHDVLVEGVVESPARSVCVCVCGVCVCVCVCVCVVCVCVYVCVWRRTVYAQIYVGEWVIRVKQWLDRWMGGGGGGAP